MNNISPSLKPGLIRFWAAIDLCVGIGMLMPPFASAFIALLYTLNGLVGGTTAAPTFDAIHWLFVYLTGALTVTWAVARLLHPISLLAVVDGWARLWVAGVLAYAMLGLGAPSVLWLFVLTESAGGVVQLGAAYRKA